MGGGTGRCLSGIAAAALAGLLGGCGEEPIPETVTFEPTIRQLFAAHCVRCHGAGGTLNGDPLAFNGDKPTSAYLNQLGDTGDCTFDPVTMTTPASCKRGARYAAESITLYVHSKGSSRMPPAPSDRLTDWELALVDRWALAPQ